MKSVNFRLAIFLIVSSMIGKLCALDLPPGVSLERFSTELLWNSYERTSKVNRPRVILVLGGGGGKGLSHIGVLRVLREEHIQIDEIVGVSVGALIGAVVSAGMTDVELESMANEIGWNKLTNMSQVSAVKMILSDELISTDGMEQYLKRHIANRTFAELNIPFSCVATDIRTGERLILNEGPVAFAARASATIPGIFKPVPYRQRLLVDGGLVDNLPTDVARPRDGFDLVIGVLPKSDKLVSENLTVFRAFSRAIEIQGAAIVRENAKLADVLIEPEVGNVSIYDLRKSKECIEAGTLAARKKTLLIKRLLIERYRSRLGKS